MGKILNWVKANPKKVIVAVAIAVGGVVHSTPVGDVIREVLRVLGL